MKFDFKFGMDFINKVVDCERGGYVIVSKRAYNWKRLTADWLIRILMFLPVVFCFYAGLTGKMSGNTFMTIMVSILAVNVAVGFACLVISQNNRPFYIKLRELKKELPSDLLEDEHSSSLIMCMSLMGDGEKAIKVFKSDNKLMELIKQDNVSNEAEIDQLIEDDCHKIYDQYGQDLVSKAISKLLASNDKNLHNFFHKELTQNFVSEANVAK